MTKCFIKGETESSSIILYFIDNITHERSIEEIPFNDFFYIKLEDFPLVKDGLKKRFGNHILKIVSYEAKNGEFAKIILKNNNMKHFIKEYLDEQEIKHYIADLDATKHYTIINFNNLKFNITESPYLFYDIETKDENNFKYDDNGRVVPENTILSLCAIDNKGNEFKIINEDANNPECEKKLLLQAKELFLKYAVVSAYNGSMFDDVYLHKRADLYNIDHFMGMISRIDYLFTYKKYRLESTLDSYSLNNVSKVELGETKLEGVKGGGGRIYQLYLNDKEKLLEYNMQDVRLLYRLNLKMKFLELHLMTADLAKCRVDLTNYNIGSNDYFILIEAYKRNIIAPSAPNREEIDRRRRMGSIGGGYTRGFLRQFHKDVGVFDFNSLYPSLEITFNISPETYVMSCTTKDKIDLLEPMHKKIKVFNDEQELNQYCKDNNYIRTFDDLTYVAKRNREIYHPYRIYKQDDGVGMLPTSMLNMIKLRAEIKKQMKIEIDKDKKDMLYCAQLSWKYSLVSSYGLNASPVYRYFNFDLCDSITANGRAIIKRVNEYIKSLGCLIIYNDSDSVGFKKTSDNLSYEQINGLVESFLDDLLRISNNSVFKRVNSRGKEVNHRLIMEFEKKFDALLYSKKKRYAGRIGEDMKVVGLESTQMNILAAKLQDELLKDVLFDKFDKKLWQIKIGELYRRCFNGGLTSDELFISKKYSMNIEQYNGYVYDSKTNQPRIKANGEIQYKTLPAHIELVKRMLAEGKEVFLGDKIPYIIKSTEPKQFAVSPEEFEKDHIYAREHYWSLITSPTLALMGLYMGKEAFDIINIPEREELLLKIKKESEQQTLFGQNDRLKKLQEKLRLLEQNLLENDTDENEKD
jgi:DNA polymerase I